MHITGIMHGYMGIMGLGVTNKVTKVQCIKIVCR